MRYLHRYFARKEYFGLLLYDKETSSTYVLRNVHDLNCASEILLHTCDGKSIKVDPNSVERIGRNAEIKSDFGAEKLKLGNLKETSLSDIWSNSRILKEIRDEIVPPECSNCVHHPYCRGGSVLNYKLSAMNQTEATLRDCPLLPNGPNVTPRLQIAHG